MGRLRPPKTVKIGGMEVKVKIVQQKERGVYGRSNARLSEIEADQYLSPSTEASTLLHEVLHQIFDIYYMHKIIPKKQTENAVLMLELALFTFIRDNPEFIRYLQRSK